MIREVLRIGVAGCMLLGATAQAQFEMEDMPEETAPKVEKKERKKRPAKPAVELKELTLRGTIAKQEKERKGKKLVTYQLQEQSGLKITLPKAKGIDLDQFVDQEVTVTGQGSETKRKGKKVVMLRKITDVRLVEQIEEEPEAPEVVPEEDFEQEDVDEPEEDPFEDAG